MTKRVGWLTVGGACVVPAVSLAVVWWPTTADNLTPGSSSHRIVRDEETAARTTDQANRLDAHGRALLKLQGELRELREAGAGGKSITEHTADQDTDLGPPRPPPVRAMATQLEERLREEDEDFSWSESAQREANEAIVSRGSGLRLDEVRCGVAFCRATLSHSEYQAIGDDLDELTSRPPFNGHGFVYIPKPEDEAAPTAVVYFARDGYRLPIP